MLAKVQAAKAFRREIALGRKGPQTRPPPSEEDRFWSARWCMRASGKRASFVRHENRFCVRPLDQLRGLPLVLDDMREPDGRSVSGVYFLWYGPILMYIGKSVDISNRVFQHSRTGKVFTHATFFRGPYELIRAYEADHVVKYKPPLNFTSTG